MCFLFKSIENQQKKSNLYLEGVFSMNEDKRAELIQSFKENKYERSRYLIDFHVAWFAYYDGLGVIEELTLGKSVDLLPESDNPYDPEAVVIFYQDRKIGHVPKDKNDLLSKILYFGHADIL